MFIRYYTTLLYQGDSNVKKKKKSNGLKEWLGNVKDQP